MLEAVAKKLSDMIKPSEGADKQATKTEFIKYVTEEFKRRQDERRPLEQQWLLNKAFLDGNQYCEINNVTKTIEETPRMSFYEEREVFNELAPIYETRIAKLGRLRPVLSVRPFTSEADDIASAKVSTALLKGTYNDLNMMDKTDEFNAILELYGTAIFKTPWNKDGGDIIGELEDGEKVREGKPDTVVCTPFEVFPDSIYNESESQIKSIIHARSLHRDEIKETYGITVEGREVGAYSVSDTNVGYGGLGYNSQQAMMQYGKRKKHEIVLEYWEKPSKLYPSGRMGVVINDKCVHLGPLPYKIGPENCLDLPFVKTVSIRVPGMYFGKSPIERLIPIQRRYNAISNRIAEYLNRVAIGALDVEDGALVNQDEIESTGLYPGVILIRRPGAAPIRYVDNDVLPPTFMEEKNWCIEEFIRISGISEISRNSQAPSGVSSGTALEILREQDDTRLSSTAERIRNAVVLVGKNYLRLYKQYSRGNGITKYMGDSEHALVMHWKASDLGADDVIIENSNELSETHAQKSAKLREMLQYGLFNDPETNSIDPRMRAKILEMEQLGNWEDAYDVVDLHRKRAVEENYMAEQGVVPQLDIFDDHEVHYVEHLKLRMSGAFKGIIKNNPEVAEALTAHILEHEQGKYTKRKASVEEEMSLMPQQPMQ